MNRTAAPQKQESLQLNRFINSPSECIQVPKNKSEIQNNPFSNYDDFINSFIISRLMVDSELTPGTPSVSQEHTLDGTQVYCNYVHVLDFLFFFNKITKSQRCQMNSNLCTKE